MKTSRFIVGFLSALIVALLLSFSIHVLVRYYNHLGLYGDHLISAYGFNFVIASTIILLLYAFRERLKLQVGFLFMGGSLLKFGLFFIFFYPSYTANGQIETSEFAAFFVPYLVSLTTETIFASKMLAILEREDSRKQSGNPVK